jgi:hypothetical protein
MSAVAVSHLETILQASRRIPSARSASGHVSVNVVRRWVYSGKITRHYQCGQLMVDRAEVDAILAKRSSFTVPTKSSVKRWQELMAKRAIEHLLPS